MAKIDLEKLICSLAERNIFLRDALKEQGLEYKDGEIVEIQKTKFKVGDWVVDEQGNSFIINSIERGFYFTQLSGCCYQTPLDIDLVDNSYHAWTLEDARDGDVLYYISDSGIEYIVMNKGINMYNNVDSYFRYNSINGFAIDVPSVLSAENDSITPATNAQRALLFQKMKEAGYTFDFDKKELKPIDNRFDYENANIQQKDYAHEEDVEPFDKYEGLTDFEKTLADICIGWIGEEPGWKSYIKDNADVLLKIAIEKFNKGFDPVDDEELFFGDFRKTDSEDKGKASFANRQLYNRAILKILSDYVEKYPDIRFGQMLCNLDVNPHFDQESRETYQNLNKTINKKS